MFRKLLTLTLLLTPAVAHADWRAATSDHFIVYTEGSEASAREIATKLEKFEFIMRTVSNTKRPSSSVKVKVFMLRTQDDVQAVMPFDAFGVAGFYNTDSRGPYAVMTRFDTGGTGGLRAQQILFHELTHHFMFQYFPAVYPAWYIEGFADYYGTLEIKDNDVVQIGQPMDNRYLSISGNEWLPLPRLLTARTYGDVGRRVDLLYAEGWLLVHYLANSDKRAGQLSKYLGEINDGKTFEAAAKDAFGDLNKLDSELRDYAASRIDTVILPFKTIDPGKITIRNLSPAENVMIDADIKLYAGIPKAKIAAFADTVAADAARFPDAPYALDILAEAEMLADRRPAARVAVDHWLKITPDDPFALMLKGELECKGLHAAGDKDEDHWDAARKNLIVANRKAPKEPRILKAYYDSFIEQGVLPPAGAQNALIKAFELVPQDDEIRYEVASDFEKRGYIEDAIKTIRPSAFALRSEAEQSPKEKAREANEKKTHALAGDDDEETPREMLNRLEKKLAESK